MLRRNTNIATLITVTATTDSVADRFYNGFMKVDDFIFRAPLRLLKKGVVKTAKTTMDILNGLADIVTERKIANLTAIALGFAVNGLRNVAIPVAVTFGSVEYYMALAPFLISIITVIVMAMGVIDATYILFDNDKEYAPGEKTRLLFNRIIPMIIFLVVVNVVPSFVLNGTPGGLVGPDPSLIQQTGNFGSGIGMGHGYTAKIAEGAFATTDKFYSSVWLSIITNLLFFM